MVTNSYNIGTIKTFFSDSFFGFINIEINDAFFHSSLYVNNISSIELSNKVCYVKFLLRKARNILRR